MEHASRLLATAYAVIEEHYIESLSILQAPDGGLQIAEVMIVLTTGQIIGGTIHLEDAVGAFDLVATMTIEGDKDCILGEITGGTGNLLVNREHILHELAVADPA